ncbi:phosphoesterase [Candidatus Thorarchaeota archaeon]|nr:MAG: phosphoesterase [Candidatus Thorarchaeota archaeon]
MTRLFFSCDAHGSVPVLRKMARVHQKYNCDVVMMCGDLTGKALVPIIEEKPGEWWSAPYGKKEKYKSQEKLDEAKKMYEKRGFYWFMTTQGELEELQQDKERVQALFNKLMEDRMEWWLDFVRDAVPSDIKVVISPGNDDHEVIDHLIKENEQAIYPIERVVQIDDTHSMISCEWVNTTPWENTPRECSEEELMDKLETEFDRVDNYENLLCNFHAPPYGTRIDLAPKLDENLQVKVRFGRPPMENVGSTSVRKAFEKYQPMLGLHGHIHESAGTEHIGRTLCINPGSVYLQGMVNAFVIDLPDDSSEKVEVLNVSA